MVLTQIPPTKNVFLEARKGVSEVGARKISENPRLKRLLERELIRIVFGRTDKGSSAFSIQGVLPIQYRTFCLVLKTATH